MPQQAKNMRQHRSSDAKRRSGAGWTFVRASHVTCAFSPSYHRRLYD